MKGSLLAFLIVGFAFLSFAQRYTISGYMQDMESGEKLIAANVLESRTQSGTSTNNFGFYSITLESDTVSIFFSYVGYQTQGIEFLLTGDTTINVSLESIIELEEVEIVAEQYDRIEQETQMSRIEIPIEQIRKVPALLGEVDVLKTIQLLPGVQSGEGQSGFYVRGGSPDQNLILLDGVPVYNVSHLLGVFSVFNADAIKSVTLTKGGFPARFGGRLSSILEINMKDGHMHEFHGAGSLGLISSKLTLEGPIVKEKSSFIISARRTYADLILRPIIKSSQTEGVEIDPRLYFYDLNGKLNFFINKKNRIYLSAYGGSDVFKNVYSEDRDKYTAGINWGNIISALRWNCEINKKLFSNVTLTYSNYDIDIIAGQESVNENNIRESFSAKYISGITDWAGKIDFDFLPSPDHFIRFGASITDHAYRPGALALNAAFSNEQFDTLIGSSDEHSKEYALYIEDDFSLGRFKVNAGVHASWFSVDDHIYNSIQPRLGMRYLLTRDLAIKASYSRMTQYINLLTSEAFSLPTDLWVPSTLLIKPQESWQAALGFARTLSNEYEVSLEGYYKEMDHVLSFKEGASFLLGLENDWQDKVTQGDGESYGVELLVQKKEGRLTGWIGYTLSRNYRQFDEINGGRKFPYRYDRRHDFSIVGTFEISPRVHLSANWVFGTGNAITLPTYRYPADYDFQEYVYQGQIYRFENFTEIESLGEKNAFRMSNYHRLDIGIDFIKKKPKWERTWNISVYNVYWHRNPFYIVSSNEVITDPNTGQVKEVKRVFKEISILLIIPSISYSFKF